MYWIFGTGNTQFQNVNFCLSFHHAIINARKCAQLLKREIYPIVLLLMFTNISYKFRWF